MPSRAPAKAEAFYNRADRLPPTLLPAQARNLPSRASAKAGAFYNRADRLPPTLLPAQAHNLPPRAPAKAGAFYNRAARLPPTLLPAQERNLPSRAPAKAGALGNWEHRVLPTLRPSPEHGLHQGIVQISPIRISLFDQPNFPSSFPFFHPVFARPRVLQILEELEPHKQDAIFVLRVTVNQLISMLVCALWQVTGYAQICLASTMIGHQVDTARLHRTSSNAPACAGAHGVAVLRRRPERWVTCAVPHKSISIRVGSSIAFLSATRNVTASRPSIRR